MAPSLLSNPSEPVILAGPPGTPEVTLAPVSAGDVSVLARAFAAMSPWSRYPLSEAAFVSYFSEAEPGAPRFTIRSNGEIAGAFGLRLNWLRGPYVQSFGLLPAFQNLGLGARILARLDADARAANAANLWLAVSDFNADAMRFYERAGFTRVAGLDDLVKDGFTEFLMRKRL